MCPSSLQDAAGVGAEDEAVPEQVQQGLGEGSGDGGQGRHLSVSVTEGLRVF